VHARIKHFLRGTDGLYAGGKRTKIDGLRLDFPDWWFIVRESNAEPVLRLVIETSTPDDLCIRAAELCAAIRRVAG
jgi:phosphomannomutase